MGVHVSIAGGVEKAVLRARELSIRTMQIFSRSPRGWKVAPLMPSSVSAFREGVRKEGIEPVFIHTPYLLNLATAEVPLSRQSSAALALDMGRAEELGAQYVVTHLGSGRPEGPASAIDCAVEALKRGLEEGSEVFVLLENSAGARGAVGARFEELQEIIERVGGDRLGVCFDSCHGFAAGYDFRTPETARELVRQMEVTFGLKRLALLHVNDSVAGLGGHLDRHAHIGQGQIGRTGFRSLLSEPRLRKLPLILETPKKLPGDDRRNLARIHRLLREADKGGIEIRLADPPLRG
ncbi:MAG: deoxyribonuclease IV [Deltaproteobacteria bacterium]|nr:deoxyribonuclease IV [Deltaproteobacteria bacterium]